MDLAALSVASLSALFTAVAATAAWQAARVGLGPAQLIGRQLEDGDSSGFALSLTPVRSSDGRRASSPPPIHLSSRVRPAPASTPSRPSTEEPRASSSRRSRSRPSTGSRSRSIGLPSEVRDWDSSGQRGSRLCYPCCADLWGGAIASGQVATPVPDDASPLVFSNERPF
jgi:hypothetical protein